jgi:ankyrin repeat protein
MNAKEMDGTTPLHLACINEHEAIISLMLEKGTDPTITNNKGKTPLQIAQEYNQNCVAAIEQFQPRF